MPTTMRSAGLHKQRPGLNEAGREAERVKPAPSAVEAAPIASRIAEARHRAGLTARELAQQTGLSLWDVERLEAGQLAPGDTLERIAAATGATTAWFTEPVSPAAGPNGAANVLRRRPHGTPTLTAGLACWVVLASVVLLVGVRFFTEVVMVLPRAANFVDVPILAALLVASLLVPPPPERRAFGLLLPATAFIALCVISVLANAGRVDAAPALLFVYGFLAPFAVFWSVYRIWPGDRALALSRLLVALGLIQLLIVAAVDLPKFLATEDPDVISGTFGENPYQLVFFLLVFVGLLAGIFTFEHQRRIARAVPLLFVAIFVVIFMAQYRALLLTTALTVLALGAALAIGRPRGVIIGAMALAALIATLSLTAKHFSALKLETTVTEFSQNPTYYAAQRFGVLQDVGRLYGDDARYTLTGTGPGTYSSRAFKTFATFGSGSASNVAGSYVSKLTGGEVYRTDVSDKYVIPRLRTTETISGSRAVTSSLSSWLSLMAEVGVLGLLLMMLLYGLLLAAVVRRISVALRTARQNDPLTALLLAAGTSLFVLVQMGFLENWLEVSRVTFIAMTIVAVAVKEFDRRAQIPA